MAKKNTGKNTIAQREGEIWGMATYYFFCPVCDKSYSLQYDASARKRFDGRFEPHTCFIQKGQCRFCETTLSVAYSADQLGIVAYDDDEEKRWAALFDNYRGQWKKLKKIKRELEKNPDKGMKRKKDAQKKMCRELEQEILASEERYAQRCEQLLLARERQESSDF